jgi:CRISPR-associated exonuclease Cas4
MPMNEWFLIAAILLVLALVCFLFSRQQQKSSGLPGLRVVYTDTRLWGRLERPLYDPNIGLTGKPDYIIEQKGSLIPVEVKSSFAPEIPYRSHVLQLAAYCILIERSQKKRPPYGLIHYSNRTFAVDFTPQLESDFLELVEEIHHSDRSSSPARSHQSKPRCEKCGYRSICDQKL